MPAMMKKTGKSLALASSGLLYLLWLRLTGIGIPCLFRLLTGWKCPGCGVTHMVLALSRLDFPAAWEANPFLLLTLPFLIAEIFRSFSREISGSGAGAMPQWEQWLLWGYIAALIIFGVARNV
jgi:hypothetical protein